MELTIISGDKSKHFLSYLPSDTVKDLKLSFAKLISVPEYSIRFIHSGIELKPDTKQVNSFGIGKYDNWNVHAIVKVVDLSSLPSSSSSSSSRSKLPTQPLTHEVVDLTEDTDNVDNNIVVSSSSQSKRKRNQASSSRNADTSSSSSSTAFIDLVSNSDSTEISRSSRASRHRIMVNLEEDDDEEEEPPRRIRGGASRRRQPSAATCTSAATSAGSARVATTGSTSTEPLLEPEHDSDGDEKRASRYRNATAQDQVRVGRALSQRLYLLRQTDSSSSDMNLERHYDVLGSTGNVYQIVIGKVPTCSCPDFAHGNICKHVIFVMVKVLRVSSSSPFIHQKALLQSELRTIFAKTDTLPAAVTADSQTMKAYRDVMGISADEELVQPPESAVTSADKDEEDKECPICFDMISTSNAKERYEDCIVCKIRIHSDCIGRWLANKADKSCPQCRSNWRPGSGSNSSSSSSRKAGHDGAKYKNGYLNLC